jgi:plastocyanin
MRKIIIYEIFEEPAMKKLLSVTLFLLANTAFAADAEFTIVIREHKFEPAELTVPAGKKIKLLIENKDSTPEEFESYALAREKVITGNSATSLYIGPLKAGRYPFFGDYHQSTAKGVVIAQ